MLGDALCSATLELVINFLVVAKVEALLLEFPLHVPVGLGDEQEPAYFLLIAGITSLQYSDPGRRPA